MVNRRLGRFAVTAAIGLMVLAMSCTQAMADQIQRVQSDRVCMVNDTVFPNRQIPVEVEQKTYFGCCEMCKGRLGTDAAVRSALDPVSGKPVDKAVAVIGALPTGKVLYFENEQNLQSYGKAK